MRLVKHSPEKSNRVWFFHLFYKPTFIRNVKRQRMIRDKYFIYDRIEKHR